MDNHIKKQIDEVYNQAYQWSMKYSDITIEHVLFTWRWWLLIFLTIVPWIVWVKIRKKDSTSRLIYVGLLVAMIAVFLDFVGISYGLWSYYINFGLPVPPLLAWDMTIIPITTMLFLQYKRNIHPFIKSIIYAAFISFFGEPLLKWLQFYNPKHWEYIYSFFIYIAIYFIAEYTVTRNSFNKL